MGQLAYGFLIKQLVVNSKKIGGQRCGGQTKRSEKKTDACFVLFINHTNLQFNTFFFSTLFSGFERTNKRPDLFFLTRCFFDLRMERNGGRFVAECRSERAKGSKMFSRGG